MTMAKTMPALALVVGVGLCGCATEPSNLSQRDPVAPTNTAQGLAVKGYDPVAYFTNHVPEQGQARYSYVWHGVTWRFASAQDRDLFKAMPTRYAPQYGGYCAFAISRGFIADVDPKEWNVVGGKLYLNNNAFSRTLWNKDRPQNIAVGDRNWPLTPKLAAPQTAAPQTAAAS